MQAQLTAYRYPRRTLSVTHQIRPRQTQAIWDLFTGHISVNGAARTSCAHAVDGHLPRHLSSGETIPSGPLTIRLICGRNMPLRENYLRPRRPPARFNWKSSSHVNLAGGGHLHLYGPRRPYARPKATAPAWPNIRSPGWCPHRRGKMHSPVAVPPSN